MNGKKILRRRKIRINFYDKRNLLVNYDGVYCSLFWLLISWWVHNGTNDSYTVRRYSSKNVVTRDICR